MAVFSKISPFLEEAISSLFLSYRYRVGPQLGHETGSALNLLEDISEYSSAHSEHISKTDKEVLALSYARAFMTVNLGPQFWQFMNGYRYLLLFGSKSSFLHSSHIDKSGGKKAVMLPDSSLGRATKPLAPV